MEFDFDQISELLGSMSEEELQNLQETAQMLFSSFGGAEQSAEPPPYEQQASGRQQSTSGGDYGGSAGLGGMFTPEMLAKLTALMQHMNRRDPRTDLILALKPHLSPRRRQRAEQAVQMMKMLELLPALQEAFQ